jgi:hypothetical protein
MWTSAVLVRAALAGCARVVRAPGCAAVRRAGTVTVQEALKRGPGSPAQLRGWVRTARLQKRVGFLEITDGSCWQGLQVVLSEEVLTAHKAALEGVGAGTAVAVTGELVPSPKPAQPFEFRASAVSVVGPCDQASYPLQKKVRRQVVGGRGGAAVRCNLQPRSRPLNHPRLHAAGAHGGVPAGHGAPAHAHALASRSPASAGRVGAIAARHAGVAAVCAGAGAGGRQGGTIAHNTLVL